VKHDIVVIISYKEIYFDYKRTAVAYTEWLKSKEKQCFFRFLSYRLSVSSDIYITSAWCDK